MDAVDQMRAEIEDEMQVGLMMLTMLLAFVLSWHMRG